MCLSVGGVFSQSRKSFIEHNCLNHHPYGTFYYNKKNGRTGRHFYRGPRPPPRTTSAQSNDTTAKCNGPTTPVQPREVSSPPAPLLRPLPDEPIQLVGNHVVPSPGNQTLLKLKKYEFGFDLEYEDRYENVLAKIALFKLTSLFCVGFGLKY